jgi:hypothetical protein
MFPCVVPRNNEAINVITLKQTEPSLTINRTAQSVIMKKERVLIDVCNVRRHKCDKERGNEDPKV